MPGEVPFHEDRGFPHRVLAAVGDDYVHCSIDSPCSELQ